MIPNDINNLEGYDETDYVNRNRVSGFHRSTKAQLLDCLLILVSIATYVGDIVTDVLLSLKFYVNSQWLWFCLVVTFLVVPSIILQVLSNRWYNDDYGKHSGLSVFLHILQFGPIERFSLTFYHGMKTILCRSGKEQKNANYEIYLENWRDISMLRFLESFLEGAPQVLIQLFIIFQYDSVTLKSNWLNVVSVMISIVSLAWSIVTYTYVQKLCETHKTYSIFGYIFQVLYRIFMVTSRIMAILVFTIEYKWITFIIMFIHWLLMIYWLSNTNSDFCLGTQDSCLRHSFESLFSCILGFVYIFCFINTKEGATRVRVSVIYTVFLIENSIMAAAWLAAIDRFGPLEYGLIFLIWGSFLIGIVCMLLYYQFFHPSKDVSSGWCHCCTNSIVLEEEIPEPSYTCTGGVKRLQSNVVTEINIVKEKVKVNVEFAGRKRISSSENFVEDVGEQQPLKTFPDKSLKDSSKDSTFEFDCSGFATQQFF